MRIALKEKNLEAELVELDMRARENKSSAYLAKNPYGRVPTLEHDDFVLFESTAILDYLESIQPSPALMPSGAKPRALAVMHIKLCDLEFGSQTRSLIFPARFLPKERWDAEAMNAGRARINAHLAILDAQLGSREWLVGDAFSFVEVCYAPFVRFLGELELEVPARVRAWSERILARPSVRATWLER